METFKLNKDGKKCMVSVNYVQGTASVCYGGFGIDAWESMSLIDGINIVKDLEKKGWVFE